MAGRGDAYIQMGPRNGSSLRRQEGRRGMGSPRKEEGKPAEGWKPGHGRKHTPEGIAHGQLLQMGDPWGWGEYPKNL